ncbi:hypothetical protein G7075_13560 [Phycicoccus sp. HDW14]|uniref:hypothetical protein n=1 Tax=Phycicoccus sp. HDW14 TaxID=2714941 RepID=UPI00140E221B|nr:hypothetical protein [Phycicoccus sp. HDW14]QIM21910.1 hypothetical protein G7075_13560 [Phycicoccus sp. HDW14]
MASRGRRVAHSPERFGFGALFGVLMFVPAGLLVYRGNLSVEDAVLRFGLAWTVAVMGVGVVASVLHGSPGGPVRPRAAAPARPAEASGPAEESPAP